MEQHLAARSGVPHRLVVTDSDLTITDASNTAAVSRDIRELYRLESSATSDLSRGVGHSEGASWLVSSQPFGSAGRRLFLMRSSDERAGIVKRFVGLHLLHGGVTLVLFFLLLRFLGERFIRHPIQRLAAHVRRIEAGEFETSSETYENDEFGWLAERFTEMGLRLHQTVRSQVRTEKLASAGAVAYRVARESAEPLNDLRRQITVLEASATDDLALTKIARSLKADHQRLVDAVVRLQEVSPAETAEP